MVFFTKYNSLVYLLWGLLLIVLVLPITAQADINSFVAGMTKSGSVPFDSNDVNARNTDVRTHDDATYRTAFSLSSSDTNAQIRFEMGSFTLPNT